MAEDTAEVAEDVQEEKKGGLIKTLMIPVIVGVVCAGIGFAIPMAFPSLIGADSPVEEVGPVEPLFLKFGEVVVNLNEGGMSRYLRLGITLQVAGTAEEEPELTELIETKRSIMTSWLLGYLADMGMDDVRGAAGQNRLRREINDQFNWVLFPDGEQKVDDILFEDFNIQ